MRSFSDLVLLSAILFKKLILIVILKTFFCKGSDDLRELKVQRNTRRYRGVFLWIVIQTEHLKMVILEITSLAMC